MEIAGPAAELQIVDEGSVLTFRSVPRRRWVDFLGPLAILGVVLAGDSWVYRAFVAAILAGWFIFWWKQTPDELWVTDIMLVSSKSVSMNWSDVRGLEYGHGGEDDPSGLYARRPWGAVCLLPHVNEEQAGQIIDAVYTRFTNLQLADEGKGWSLFGKQSELLSLGLSKPRE